MKRYYTSFKWLWGNGVVWCRGWGMKTESRPPVIVGISYFLWQLCHARQKILTACKTAWLIHWMATYQYITQFFFLRGPRGEQSNAASTLQVLSEEERRVSAIPHRLTFLIFNKKITPGLQIFPSIIHLRMQTIDQWCADYTIHYFIQFKRFQWEILNFDYKFIFHLCFLDLPCLTSLVF